MTIIHKCIDDNLIFDIIPYTTNKEQLLYVLTDYPNDRPMRKNLWNRTLEIIINDKSHKYYSYCCPNKSCFVLIFDISKNNNCKILNLNINHKDYHFEKSIDNKLIVENSGTILCTFESSHKDKSMYLNTCIYTNDFTKYSDLSKVVVESKKLNVDSAILHAKIMFRNWDSTIINFKPAIKYNTPITQIAPKIMGDIENIIPDVNNHKYNIIPNSFEYDSISIIYDIIISPLNQHLYFICPNIKRYLINRYNKSHDNLQIFVDGVQYIPSKVRDNSTLLLIIEKKFINSTITVVFGDTKKTYNICNSDNYLNKMIMSTVFKDENNLIDSWIKYHKKIGFDLFILYNNNPNNKLYYSELINRYPNQIIFIDWGYPYELYESGISAQTTQQTHTLLKHQTAKYIALTDLDEYIVSLNKPLSNFFDEYECMYDQISAFTIETNWFGCGNECAYLTNDSSADFTNKMIYRCNTTTGPLQHQKAIINPKNVILFNIHEPSVYNGMYIFVNPNIIRMNHYYTLSSKKRLCNCMINCAVRDDYITTI